MNEGIVLLNREYLWPILIGGLLLWAVFLWKEWPERKLARGRVKILVSFLGLTALALMVLGPAIPAKASLGKGILISQGHRPEALDSLRALYGRIPVEAYVPGQTLGPLGKVDSLFVLGQGPEAFDRWQLQSRSINFLGGPVPMGLVDIVHPHSFYLGETLSVQAEFQEPGQGHMAFLRDPAGNPLDSVALGAGGRQYFTLGARPKARGLFVYSLEVRDQEGTTVAMEPLPVDIKEPRSLDILVLERFPSFEGKYLKNFLAQRGHRLLVRSQLSRGRYKYEAFNRERARFRGFGPESLADFDLILMDGGTYLGLGRSDKAALEGALREHGIGLLILPEGPLFTAAVGSSPFRFAAEDRTTVRLEPGSQRLEKYPYAFQEEFPLQIINIGGTTVAGYMPMEKGRVATTLVRDSYQWILGGKGELYATLWTGILDATVPGQGTWAEWKALDPLPRVDAPFEFELWTPLELPMVKSGNGASIPLIQAYGSPTQWQGRLYPKKAGWNHLELPGDSLPPYSLYVFDKGERSAMGQAKRLEANVAHYGQSKTFGPLGKAVAKRPTPLSPFWFFVPWLLALGWLWLEPKIRGGRGL